MKTRTSEGEVVLVSDFWKGNQDDSIAWNAVKNKAKVISFREEEINVNPFYFGLRVASGKVFVLFDRTLILTEGAFNIDVCSDSGTFDTTGATELTQASVDQRQTDTLESSVWSGVTPGGTVTVQEYGFADTGQTIATARAAGAVGTDDLVKRFTSDGLLRIENSDAATTPYTATLVLVGWEEDL